MNELIIIIKATGGSAECKHHNPMMSSYGVISLPNLYNCSFCETESISFSEILSVSLNETFFKCYFFLNETFYEVKLYSIQYLSVH